MKPEINTATAETVQTGSDQAVAPAAPCSPVVTWQAAKLRSMNDEAVALNAWVLAVDGKAILTAVAGSEIHEAVTPENRKLIGKALAEYLANRVVPIEVLAGKLEEATAKVDFPNLKPIPGADFYAAAMVPSPTQFGAHQEKGLLKRLQGMVRFLCWIWRGGHPSDFPPSATSVNRGFSIG